MPGADLGILFINVNLSVLSLFYFLKRTIILFQGPKEKYGSLHTFLRGRDGRIDQPGLCSH